MKTTKRIISMILSLCMLFCSITVTNLNVYATSKTKDQAISWVKSKSQVSAQVGSGQCVALIQAYYEYLGENAYNGNACDYIQYNDGIPQGWKKLKKVQPQKGDVLLYTGGIGGLGHVAIYESDYVTYHQNFNGLYVERVTNYKYDGFHTEYWGVIRPNFADSSEDKLDAPANLRVKVCGKKLEMRWDSVKGANGYSVHIVKPDGTEFWGYSPDPSKNYDISTLGKYTVDIQSLYRINGSTENQIVSAHTKTDINVNIYGTDKLDVVVKGDRFYLNWNEVEGADCYDMIVTTPDGSAHWYHTSNNSGSIPVGSPGKYIFAIQSLNRSGTTQIVGGYSNDYEYINTGSYYIVSALDEHKVVSFSSPTEGMNENVNINEFNATNSQKFYIVPAGNNTNYIYSLETNKVLDVKNGSSESGANVQLYQQNNTDAQKWTFEDAGNGYFYLKNGRGNYLDVAGGGTSNGTNIQVYTLNKSISQKFKFVRTLCSECSVETIEVSNCKKNGIDRVSCLFCKNNYLKETKKVEHIIVNDNAVSPTCTKIGLTEGKHCSVCGTVLVAQHVIKATGHNSVLMNNAVTPTCTTVGKESDTKCSTCGVKLSTGKTIPAKGHNYATKVVKSTYAAKGYTLHTCSSCNASYKDTYTNKLTVAKPTISKVISPKSKQIKVTWSKKSYTGYQVQIATDSKFIKNKKTATIKKASTVSTTFTKLKGKTKYYVRVRAYKTYNGKDYYSAWSTVKIVTTKK